MRDVKFRGWGKQRYDWVYGYLYTFGDRAFIIEPGRPGIPEHHEGVISESVGEFTGFKERHGKELCEGDIVAGHNLANQQVVWDGRRGMWALDGTDLPSAQLSHYAEEIEIIGSAWRNPELLK